MESYEREQKICVLGRPSEGTSEKKKEGTSDFFFLLVAQGFTFSLTGAYTFYVLLWRHVLFHNKKKDLKKTNELLPT